MTVWHLVKTLPLQEARAESKPLERDSRSCLLANERSCSPAGRMDTPAGFTVPCFANIEPDDEGEFWLPINANNPVHGLIIEKVKPLPAATSFEARLNQVASAGRCSTLATQDLDFGQEMRARPASAADCTRMSVEVFSKDKRVLLVALGAINKSTTTRRCY